MKLVLLGGGGFIGSAIVERLLEEDVQIRIFERPDVRPYRRFPEGKIEWISGDLMSAHDIDRAIDGVETVIHLASTTTPKSSHEDMIYDMESNLAPSLKVLKAMTSKRIQKIIYISSGGTVYGNPVYLPIDEKHPTEPRVSYGITKLAIEKYLQMYESTHGIKVVILRVTNPFGERQRLKNAQGAVGIFINKILHGQEIEIWGDGSTVRDYLYVGDVANAFATAIRYNGSKVVFNISSGTGMSLTDLINKIEEALHIKAIRRHTEARPFDVQKNILDNSLARLELGWEPQTTFEQGIIKTADWLKTLTQIK